MQRIRKGTFHAKADVDSSFPESTSAKRQNITTFLPLAATTPLGAALFESPDNWQELLELNGNPDITLIPAIAYKKQMRELEVLLEEPPQDNSAQVQQAMQAHAAASLQAEAVGLPDPPFQPPPPLAPSIMPEPDDFHIWESKKCAEYLSSEDCWIQDDDWHPRRDSAGAVGYPERQTAQGDSRPDGGGTDDAAAGHAATDA